jgi:hypothetical protein
VRETVAPRYCRLPSGYIIITDNVIHLNYNCSESAQLLQIVVLEFKSDIMTEKGKGRNVASGKWQVAGGVIITNHASRITNHESSSHCPRITK